MNSITCPTCSSRISLTVEGHGPRPTPRLPRDFHHVQEVFSGARGEKMPFAEVRDVYARAAAARGLPPLTDRALGRRLRAAGFTPYRTATERGWEF